MDSIRIKAPSKINLYLDIVGKESNGYHSLNSVMQSLDLFDYITLSKTDIEGIEISCNVECINNQDNIAVKAANEFIRYANINTGIKIIIDKHIPIKAGLAGGSSDAAAVLYGLNILFDNPLDENDISNIASSLGSDIPFMLKGSTKLCEGTGNIISDVAPLPYDCWIVLVKPDFGVSTAEAYQKYDEHISEYHHPESVKDFIIGLESGNIDKISNGLFNIFEQIIDSEEICTLKKEISSFNPCSSLMTGSGSTVFAIFDNEENAVSAFNYFNSLDNYFAAITRPTSFGVSVDSSYKVENRLKELNIKYERIDHPSVYTMEDMYTLNIFNKGIIGKNLFIRDSKGKRHFLVFVYGDKKVNLSDLEEKIGMKHVSFGSAERLYSHLGLTKGSVSPLGVVNNEEADVEFIIDKDFINCKVIGMHPNQNTSTFWLSYQDLIKVIESNGNSITYADL